MHSPPWKPRILIFDVFNTLVLPMPGHENTFADGLRERGVQPTAELMRTLQASSERMDHTRQSISRDSYLCWTRNALDEVAAVGITDDTAPKVIPALEQLHQAPMRQLPNVEDLLIRLRKHGVMIGACSNWSWDLTNDLQRCGLRHTVDVIAASACVGYRKPHPEIYMRILRDAGVKASDAVFVGDSSTADVEGPMAVGIAAVHLLRSAEPSQARWQIRDISSLWDFLTLPAC